MTTSGPVSPVHSETIVIGAGPAGLAVGACLRQVGITCIILEQNDRVASSWHRHYDRLHLHTDKKNSGLPFFSFPKDFPRYPSRSQVIEYLETYVNKFQLDIRLSQKVLAAKCEASQWVVKTQQTLFRAPNLVIATGYNREPHIPTWPGMESFRGTWMHSSHYKNGEPFKGQRVLVVGFGNSGGEIAIDLWEHGAYPSIAVRSPVNVIPREVLGIPFLFFSIFQSSWPRGLADAVNAPIVWVAIGDLTKYGLRKFPRGPLSQIERNSRIPLIDVGTLELIKQGKISVYPGIRQFTDQGVIFDDAREEHFDALVLATGYEPRVNAFLQSNPETCDENGKPLSSGSETTVPGLYFCGYYVSPTGMLREISIEAKRISAAIARKQIAAL